MFFAKKIISYFILPPGIYIVLFLLIYLLSKRKTVKYISLLSALSLYLISIEPFKDLLLLPLENMYKRPKILKGDIIVVLGGGAYNTGYLKEDSTKRLITGFILHKKTGLPLLLSGGSALNNLPESSIMKQFLIELGVDRRLIFTDQKSRDTRENAKYVKELCKRINCRRIILVTSAYHMYRSVYTFEREGLDVIPYPTDYKTDRKYNLFSFFPKMSALKDSYRAIREYIGIIFYRLRVESVSHITESGYYEPPTV